jgi:hypothetical protein
MVLVLVECIQAHCGRAKYVIARNVLDMPTGKRSAGPFWISRPDKSQFSSVPPIVTVPDRGLKPPRPPPRPPLPPRPDIIIHVIAEMFCVRRSPVIVYSMEARSSRECGVVVRTKSSQKLFDAAAADSCSSGAPHPIAPRLQAGHRPLQSTTSRSLSGPSNFTRSSLRP